MIMVTMEQQRYKEAHSAAGKGEWQSSHDTKLSSWVEGPRFGSPSASDARVAIAIAIGIGIEN